jgi:hypothetical membrane protein
VETLSKYLVSLPIASIAIPLICIAISISLSPWFNIINNALSDLGHATESSVAPIFNFGLSLGGSLIIITATIIIARMSKAMAVSMTLTGYGLILVAIFDEVYNRFDRLHFWVSTIFFIFMSLSMIIYIIITRNNIKRVSAVILLIIGFISWILHLYYNIPPGAAIPELISIFILIPYYIDIVLRSLKKSP